MLLVGCSGDSQTQNSTAVNGLTAGEVGVTSGELESLIDQVMTEWTSAETIQRECLATTGLTIEARLLTVDVATSDGSLRTNLEAARAMGFGIVSNEGRTGVSFTVVAQPDWLANEDEIRTVLATECVGAVNAIEAQSRLRELQEQLRPSIDRATVEADPRIVDAVENWSQCMAARGYDYGAPSEAGTDWNARYSLLGPQPTPEALAAFQVDEIAVAVASAECNILEIAPVYQQVVDDLQQDQ
jgi:hypothetical protein